MIAFLCMACNEVPQPEHTPCCETHGDAMCCEHYCLRHNTSAIRRCTPDRHARKKALA